MLSDDIDWFWLNYYTNKERTMESLEKKIKSKTYEDNFNYLVELREKYKLTKTLEKMEKIKPSSIEEQSEKIMYSIKQSFEYFKLSKSANIHVKPLIIYYGMVSLSKALMDNTFIFEVKKPHHGLGHNKSYDKCYIKSKGFFTRFSACNTYIHTGSVPHENVLKLISANDMLGFEDLIYPLRKYFPQESSNYGPDIFTRVFGRHKQKYNLDPISCYIMIMYLFSMLVRYKPVEWIRIIEGRNEKYPKLDWILIPLLNLAITDYPSFILDEFRKHASYYRYTFD